MQQLLTCDINVYSNGLPLYVPYQNHMLAEISEHNKESIGLHVNSMLFFYRGLMAAMLGKVILSMSDRSTQWRQWLSKSGGMNYIF